jgi:hypothetical protein
MRSARLSTAGRGSMVALALASATLPSSLLLGQDPAALTRHRGAILVQTVDTSINPLAAEIVLPAFGLGVRVSEEGAVLLVNIPDGLYLMQARRLGYRPEWRVVRIAGDTARVDFVLTPADGRSGLAESRLRAFVQRTGAIRFGSFITRSEIERRRPRTLLALLKGVPDLTIERTGPGPSVVRSTRVARPECASGMLLFVDGMLPTRPSVASAAGLPTASGQRSSGSARRERGLIGGNGRGADAARWWSGPTARDLAGVESAMGSAPSSRTRGSSPLDWVPISLVAGVEIYPTGTDVPPEFQTPGAECGVVLLWTVRG